MPRAVGFVGERVGGGLIFRLRLAAADQIASDAEVITEGARQEPVAGLFRLFFPQAIFLLPVANPLEIRQVTDVIQSLS